jgi:hypothetical protein
LPLARSEPRNRHKSAGSRLHPPSRCYPGCRIRGLELLLRSFATVIDKWFGADPARVLGAKYPSLPLLTV